MFIAFAVMGGVQLAGLYEIDVKAAILVGVAGVPILLPILARYVKSFAVGNVQGELRQSSRDAASIAASEGADDDYGRLSINARRILRALWHYQVRDYGVDGDPRWGFGVGLGFPGFVPFSLGVQELQTLGLVVVDTRGLCFLSDHGIAFCQNHNDRLNQEELVYTNFTGVG